MLLKDKIDLGFTLDFNKMSEILDTGNFPSVHSGQWFDSHSLSGSFQINGIHNHPMFFNIFKYCQDNFNKSNVKADLALFLSFQSGVKSNTHRDDYDVYIIGALGRTLYKVEDREYIIEPGQILHIPKGHLHVAIGLDPRIVMSYGLGIESSTLKL